MKRYLCLTLMVFIFQFLPFSFCRAQLPVITKVDTFIRCIGDTIVVPVKVWNFNSISSVSLKLSYKISSLQFLTFQNIAPNLGFTSFNTIGGSVNFSSFSTNPIFLPDGATLFEAKFKYISDSSYLQWDTWTPGGCVYTDPNNPLLPASFINGVVYTGTPSVHISQNPTGSICQGTPVTFTATSILGGSSPSYVWIKNGNIVGAGTTYSSSTLVNGDQITCSMTSNAICASGNPYTSPPLTMQVNTLSVSAGIDDTIALGASVILSATVTMGAPPFTFLWSNGMTGQTGSLTPSLTGSYIVNVTDAQGCSAMDTVVITVFPPNTVFCTLPVVSGCAGEIHYPVIVSNVNQVTGISLCVMYDPQLLTYNGYQNPHPQLIQGTLTVNASNNQIQIAWNSITPVDIINTDTLLKLNFTTVNGNSALGWDLTTPGACHFTGVTGISIPAVYANGSITGIACSTIQGNITYLNNIASPLSNCPVQLINGNTNLNQNTSVSGNFTFTGLNNGTFYLQPTCNKPWGGVNANDALLIMKHFVNLAPLTGWYLKAADVDDSHFVNTTDVLMVARRFVGMIDSFVVGDWLMEPDTVIITGPSTFTTNLKGICFGDVDGSYNPPARLQPSIHLEKEGILTTNMDQEVTYPFYLNNTGPIGSVSLVLQINQEVMQVKNVHIQQEANLLYNLNGNELRIAWYSLTPIDLNVNDPLFTISGLINRNVKTTDDSWISLGPESQIGDENGIIYTDLTLKYPGIVLSNEDYQLGQNIPNPFSHQTEISYNMPAPGFVDLKVSDVYGREVLSLVRNQQEMGNHVVRFDNKQLPAGVYYYQITVKGETSYYKSARKMIVE